MAGYIPKIIGITPIEYPDPSLVRGLMRARALGVLDLGRDPLLRREAIAKLAEWKVEGYGVRIPEGASIDPRELPDQASVIIVASPADLASSGSSKTVLVQVTTLAEALLAQEAGAFGIIAKGAESGGHIGELSSYLLLQQLVDKIDIPIWVQGGISTGTSCATLVGGAYGVVLDTQLALLSESRLPAPLKRVIASMDGTETAVIGSHRVYHRPGLLASRMMTATRQEAVARMGWQNLNACLLPLGQDASFACAFAKTYRGVARLVEDIDKAMVDQVALAHDQGALQQSSLLAKTHRTTYPIVQGPMSRVSDGAAFASEVAKAGALPVLALGLMGAEDAQRLIVETKNLLGDNSFGVGIIGFAPSEVYDAQINVIQKLVPPFAIIAGGRPAQAEQLRLSGTDAYLHVPSPGLLDLFVSEGARTFIFEGRECGGHIGPFYSFVLWQNQIDHLLALESLEGFRVLFAGGIHDARSAAMVAALAAPLVARGCQVGVLMGSAYLFTAEAVSSGAILPTYQEVALACQTTVELESGPGQVTRCAQSDYVEVFTCKKRRLEEQGRSAKEIWATVEAFNIGRLLLAAKGLVKDAEDFQRIDPTHQRSAGLYMMGQLAALRNGPITMEALHRDVSTGSAEFVRIALGSASRADKPSTPKPPPVDIAIIGMACVFPAAGDCHSYFANILNGVNAITEVPKERWTPDEYYDPTNDPSLAGIKTPSKWGGFLPSIRFNPLGFGIVPKSMVAIDPVQLLSLSIAKQALCDAGYVDRDFNRDRTSVIFGAEVGTELAGAYGFRSLCPSAIASIPELDTSLPRLTGDSFAGILVNVVTGRIANRLDLRGMNCTVNAACASSLAAINLGIHELCTGGSDMVLCGGADVHNSISDYLMFSSVHALSPRDRCSPFDADADGTVLGEGVACVVLKRLADALHDGDRIYAVIKGVGSSSDGKSMGMTAPSKDGQKLAITRAFDKAGVSPKDVSMVEAHGTGTVVGDKVELEALTEVFAGAGTAVGACSLGSVKSQIGHTKCAAGIASLIKTALSVYYGVLPPTSNVNKPNHLYKPSESPFCFNRSAKPWTAKTRHGAVSAFGFGGTNYHVVLSSHDDTDTPQCLKDRPFELFVFRGAQWEDAIAKLDDLVLAMDQSPETDLQHLALATNATAAGRVQCAIVASSRADLLDKIEKAQQQDSDPSGVFLAKPSVTGKVAFLFPGQGSQRPGMLAQLFVYFPHLRHLLSLGQSIVGPDLMAAMFPPTAFTPEDAKAQLEKITRTDLAQPALGIVALACSNLLKTIGVVPDMVGGHSYGELVALCAAGVIPESDLMTLSVARAQTMLQETATEDGSMAAAAASAKDVEAALGGRSEMANKGLVIANYNGPAQHVLAGPRVAIEQAVRSLGDQKITARQIPVQLAFHSPLMNRARIAFAKKLDGIPLQAPERPVFANLVAQPYPSEPETIREFLANQISSPVRFEEEIEAMYAQGARVFVEVGPSRVLSGLVRGILGERPCEIVTCDDGSEQGLRSLFCAVAELAVLGLPVQTHPLFEYNDLAGHLYAASSARQENSDSDWWVNGHASWPVHGELPEGSVLRMRNAPWAVSNLGDFANPKETHNTDDVVQTVLNNVRDMISLQRDIVNRYLGAPPESAQNVSCVAHEAPAAKPNVRASENEAQQVPPQLDTKDLLANLLAIVAERTGYPTHMLHPDLDLEADLSIDSIKRIEILAEFCKRLKLVGPQIKDDQKVIDKLAAQKTIRSIVAWLETHLRGIREQGNEAATSQVHHECATTLAQLEPPQHISATPNDASGAPLKRYVVTVHKAPAVSANGASLLGKSFAIVNDGRQVAEQLTTLLEARGAQVRILHDSENVGQTDGLIHLGALRADADLSCASRLFSMLKESLQHRTTLVLVATSLESHARQDGAQTVSALPVGGCAGLIKTLALERPDIKTRVVDVDMTEGSEQTAKHLLDELICLGHGPVEVGYHNGSRTCRKVEEKELAERGNNLHLKLAKSSVVLITGGARGITAKVAIALARKYACRLELVGRSSVSPEGLDAELAAISDRPSLRRRLAERGMTHPAHIEAECSRIFAQTEITANLQAMEAYGSTVRYHAVDVRDDVRFGKLIDSIYDDCGKIDGVIHGAGIIEDKLIEYKSLDSFCRVVDTKARAVATLVEKLRGNEQFLAFFSSITSVFGNRGQCDYASANDCLDRTATLLNGRTAVRVVSINWGPWDGSGMVSPEVRRLCEKRGLFLIPEQAAVSAFLKEIESGANEAQVILMCGDPNALCSPDPVRRDRAVEQTEEAVP